MSVLVYVVLGVAAYIVGDILFAFGLFAGGNMFSAVHARSYDAQNYLWITIGTAGAFPGAGTALVFFLAVWAFRRVLHGRKHAGAIAKASAMLLALLLTFLAGICLTYWFAHSLTV